jgi:predicted esterase
MRALGWPLLAIALLSAPAGADDEAPPEEEPKEPKPWCAPELEEVGDGICHFENGEHDGRRTLVIFLHGLVKNGEGWQHAQQRGLVRGGKTHHFSVLAPRGIVGVNTRYGDDMVAWPTSQTAREEHEAALIEGWKAAIATLEERHAEPYDEIFVVGFSNGAYYATSLAMRAPLAGVDGYGIFAGGSPFAAQTAERAPIFLGLCSKDKTTIDEAKKLEKQLKKSKWPHKAESRKVGHAIADVHLAHALEYLRVQQRKSE